MPSDDIQFISIQLSPTLLAHICAGPKGCGAIVAVNGIDLHEAFHRFVGSPIIAPAQLTNEQAKELGDMGPASDQPDVPADQGNKGETK